MITNRGKLAHSAVMVALVLLVVAMGTTPVSATKSTRSGAVGEAAVQAARPLGTLTSLSPSRVRVSGCQGVSKPIEADLKVADRSATVPARGVIALFSGGGGTSWWDAHGASAAQAVADLQAAGFTVVQVKWASGWLASASGERAGPHALACRPATLIKWLYDTRYVPLGLNPGVGICGFCVSGNSGGASQVSYALTFYGLDAILDAVVPTGGPPHAALDSGCLRRSGESAYYYSSGQATTIDNSYGFPSGGGPCVNHDTSYTDRWINHSVEAGDVYHPATRVHFIGNGRMVAEVHGGDYFNAITSAMKVNQVDSTLPHSVQSDPEGAQMIVAALTKR